MRLLEVFASLRSSRLFIPIKEIRKRGGCASESKSELVVIRRKAEELLNAHASASVCWLASASQHIRIASFFAVSGSTPTVETQNPKKLIARIKNSSFERSQATSSRRAFAEHEAGAGEGKDFHTPAEH